MKKILLILAMLVASATFVAAVQEAKLTATHLIDNNRIYAGNSIDTNSDFRYTVRLRNTDNGTATNYSVTVLFSNKLTFVSSTIICNKNSDGVPSGFVKYNCPITPNISGHGRKDLNIVFTNGSTGEQDKADINSSICKNPGCYDYFLFSVYNKEDPAIPEFGFFLIPVGIVLGSFFLFQRKKTLTN